MLEVTPVEAYRDNYIWLVHGAGDRRKVAVVDPGDAPPVMRALRRRDLEPAAVLATHHHHDHTGGIAALVENFDIPVYGPLHEHVPQCTRGIGEGDTVELGLLDLEFEVLDIPGHTAGHIAFVGHGTVFCGDTLFSAGCGRLFEGTPEQMSRSLDKLAALPPGTAVFCGHEYTLDNLRFALTIEPDNAHARAWLEEAGARRARNEPTLPSTIGLERHINPFLRCHEPAVREAAERRCGRRLEDAVSVFAAVRAWKDGFS
ncbi:MAG TPA: hydroxyacylglutathione hydrolase [Gammaproteobacteria bacterium]|nr:hydroxyacylglutathione hydrolase [Gammaproteobacteria bacterium]